MSSFLDVKTGDFVAVRSKYSKTNSDWWIGRVIYIVCGARDKSIHSLFQVLNIDNNEIYYVNSNLVIGIVK